MKRIKYVILILLLLILIGVPAVIALMAVADAPPKRTIPNPNGYDTLLQAAEKVQSLPEDFFETEDVESLQNCLESNSQAFALVDQACGEEIVVPIQTVDLESPEWTNSVSSLRNLLRLMTVQARVAELEDRPLDAAMVYAKMLDVSERADEGGLLVHSLVSLAGKGMAHDPLSGMAESLSDDGRAQLAARLKEIGYDPIDVDAVMKRERVVVRRQFGVLRAGLMSLTSSPGTSMVTSRDQELARKYDALMRELSRPAEMAEEESPE
ncbi:MAG: hypothetical protein AAFX06_00670 [Planctomycetota bacterium]